MLACLTDDNMRATTPPPTTTTTATGYNHPVEEILDELVGCLDHPALPLLQWKEELSFVESRLPSGALLQRFCSGLGACHGSVVFTCSALSCAA
jgi:hypothetical protein